MSLRSVARSTLVLLCLAAAALSPAPAGAAEITRVASSFDKDNPFDLDVWVGFERTQRRGKITRERHQDGHIADVLELRYQSIHQSLPMRLAIGLFHDLELHVGASVVFNHDQSWWYPAEKLDDGSLAVTDANSTVHNNCLDPRGNVLDPACVSGPGSGSKPIFESQGSTHRAGFSDVSFGLAWAPLSDRRDDTKPKWVLTFDYSMPTGLLDKESVMKPWTTAAITGKGPIGDGAHRFSFSTAISKRLGAIDPYLKFMYTYGLATSNSVTNCQMNDAKKTELMGYAENCGTGPWTVSETGLKPPHVGGFVFGAEFFPFDNPDKFQSVSIDLQLGAIYISEGRTYNELSDAIGKLLYNEEYLSLGGSIGVYGRAAKYVQLRVNASLYTDTQHFLTSEPVGKDLDGACRGDASSRCVDLDNHSGEISPNFDFRYDMPGRRFRITEVTVFQIMATGVVNF
ncbi:MAG TPA: hypothetical protein VGK67_11570 [Myxococcales bacterium]|jgi:hypothetical protein